MAFNEQICFVMLLKQACLFKELVQGIGPAIYFDTKL